MIKMEDDMTIIEVFKGIGRELMFDIEISKDKLDKEDINLVVHVGNIIKNLGKGLFAYVVITILLCLLPIYIPYNWIKDKIKGVIKDD
jgi:hypothetical protein